MKGIWWGLIGTAIGFVVGLGVGLGVGFGVSNSQPRTTNFTETTTTSTTTETTFTSNPVKTTLEPTFTSTTPKTTFTENSVKTTRIFTENLVETSLPTETSVKTTTPPPYGTPAPVMNPVTLLGCPYNGSITYTLEKTGNPTADELDAYRRIEEAMDEAVEYYNCFTDLSFHVTVRYVPSVPTAWARYEGTWAEQRLFIEFGQDRYYMTLRVGMHELAHCAGVGLYHGWQQLVVDDVFIGQRATQEMLRIYSIIGRPWYTEDYGDQLLALDRWHFTPFGLLSEWEQESTDHLIANCRMVMAIRVDLGLALPESIVN